MSTPIRAPELFTGRLQAAIWCQLTRDHGYPPPLWPGGNLQEPREVGELLDLCGHDGVLRDILITDCLRAPRAAAEERGFVA